MTHLIQNSMDSEFESKFNLGLLERLDDYLIEHICQALSIPELLTFMQTCRKFSQIGQVILNQRHHILESQPSTETRFSDEARIWMDTNHMIHRDYDLPAVIFPDGSKEWYQHGLRHRNHDRPAIMRSNGDCTWYLFDQIHRNQDRPAMILEKKQKWYQFGRVHRDYDRPAIIYSFGQQ